MRAYTGRSQPSWEHLPRCTLAALVGDPPSGDSLTDDDLLILCGLAGIRGIGESALGIPCGVEKSDSGVNGTDEVPVAALFTIGDELPLGFEFWRDAIRGRPASNLSRSGY